MYKQFFGLSFLLLAGLSSGETFASDGSNAESYLDCHFLAKHMFDTEREKQYFEKAAIEFKQRYKTEPEKAQTMFKSSLYYRKGYLDGAVNALSYVLEITKGEAALTMNKDGYCDFYTW